MKQSKPQQIFMDLRTFEPLDLSGAYPANWGKDAKQDADSMLHNAIGMACAILLFLLPLIAIWRGWD